MFATKSAIRRIVLIKPCCIGDVIFATPLLTALRRGFPDAAIDWAVGSSAIAALREHPDLSAVLDSGPLANPASRPASLLKLARMLRAGRYDLAVVPDRSPLMGLAPLLAGIHVRAGLDSAGRGFTYTIKAPIDPDVVRHEADIYLDIARRLGLNVENCWANVPPSSGALAAARDALNAAGATDRPFVVIHPGGGVNPGMVMVEKRWPAVNFAALAVRVADRVGAQIVLVGAAQDREAVSAFRAAWTGLDRPLIDLTERLALPEVGALASLASLYVGNDNGVGHLAAASGAKVLMIFGPSDPSRYRPFVPEGRARVAWKAIHLPERGVSSGMPFQFDWERDGIGVEGACEQAFSLLQS
ncbi:MAG TPA: glycosyltransferase family 9 protein [Aggregatilineales bacterium]|nr:glycosyltransferase family 9 protein [Aggregatilineales bacterium]